MAKPIPTNIYQSLDNTPVQMPTRLKLPQTRTDQIRSFIREEISRAAHDRGVETFEEADDFDLEDMEAEPLSRYEQMLLEPPVQEEKNPELEKSPIGEASVRERSEQAEGSPKPAQPESV